jgi:MFS transporter, BCD family, chlorophyll transporter
MTALTDRMTRFWQEIGTGLLPFADAATPDLPLSRLLRLALFQVSVGLVTVLAVGTLNRVMIVELGVPASIVSIMIALPVVVAPFRALVGHRSDTYRSALGWRRVPFLWFGSLAMFGGLAIMPFALLILSGDGHVPAWVGMIATAVSFLLMGAGLQVTQTAGLALATDLSPPEKRPQVVALMYVMLLLGMLVSSFVLSILLSNYSPLRLIQVIQGAAVVVMVLNVIAMWKQEARNPELAASEVQDPTFSDAWKGFSAHPGALRFLVVVGLGTAAFNMQDIILEPYGGEILGMTVGGTTALTAVTACGALVAFLCAAAMLKRGFDPHRLAALGLMCGLPAFALVLLAAPMAMPALFVMGVLLIGFGGGLFAVSTLTAAMNIEDENRRGLALGAWGAVQATTAGIAIGFGGAFRDLISHFGATGHLGQTLREPAAAYGAVYFTELVLVVAALAVIGPLASYAFRRNPRAQAGLADIPG